MAGSREPRKHGSVNQKRPRPRAGCLGPQRKWDVPSAACGPGSESREGFWAARLATRVPHVVWAAPGHGPAPGPGGGSLCPAPWGRPQPRTSILSGAVPPRSPRSGPATPWSPPLCPSSPRRGGQVLSLPLMRRFFSCPSLTFFPSQPTPEVTGFGAQRGSNTRSLFPASEGLRAPQLVTDFSRRVPLPVCGRQSWNTPPWGERQHPPESGVCDPRDPGYKAGKNAQKSELPSLVDLGSRGLLSPGEMRLRDDGKRSLSAWC